MNFPLIQWPAAALLGRPLAFCYLILLLSLPFPFPFPFPLCAEQFVPNRAVKGMSSTSAVAYRPPELNSETVTSWIPLTTPYSMGLGCSSTFRSWAGSLSAWEPSYNALLPETSRCVPLPVITWWNQGNLGSNSKTVLSIGPLTCPQPFTQASSIPMDASSTQIFCCPS